MREADYYKEHMAADVLEVAIVLSDLDMWQARPLSLSMETPTM